MHLFHAILSTSPSNNGSTSQNFKEMTIPKTFIGAIGDGVRQMNNGTLRKLDTYERKKLLKKLQLRKDCPWPKEASKEAAQLGSLYNQIQ